jgi:toxin-antitoxin system PIN domain toxin
VIVPDINLLVYAYNSDAPDHDLARRWWEASLSGTRPVGLAWAVVLGYLRLMTSGAVLVDPFVPGEVIEHVRAWLQRPNVVILHPGPRHLDLLDQLLAAAGGSASLTTDAHLAALAIEHQAEVCSNDSDFSRFPGLRWSDPLR